MGNKFVGNKAVGEAMSKKKATVHYARNYGTFRKTYCWACNLWFDAVLENDLEGYEMTLDKSRVTCGNCKRTRAFRK